MANSQYLLLTTWLSSPRPRPSVVIRRMFGNGGDSPAGTCSDCRTNASGVESILGRLSSACRCWSGIDGVGRWLIGRTVALLQCWWARSVLETGVESDVADNRLGVEPLAGILVPGHVGYIISYHFILYHLDLLRRPPPSVAQRRRTK